MPHPQTEPLSEALSLPRWWEEHSELHQMVAEVTQLLATGSLAATLAAFSAMEEALEGHFSIEESLYFPLIERFAPEEDRAVRTAQRGHDRIRRALNDLQELLAGADRPGARRVLVQLLAGLSEHESHEDQLIQRLRALSRRSVRRSPRRGGRACGG